MTKAELIDRVSWLEMMYVDALSMLGDDDRRHLLSFHAELGAPTLTEDQQTELESLLAGAAT
jgi:hypothetical protein